MSDVDPYISYWRHRRAEQELNNQRLAEQARETLRKVVEILVDEFQVTKVILFGSLAKGCFSQESDIDLAVEGILASDYFHVLARVNAVSDRWIDLKPFEDLEPHFRQRVLQTGECLYASDLSQ